MDAFTLRFADPVIEAAFWRWHVVRHNLLVIDQLALLSVALNNCFDVYLSAFYTSAGAFPPCILPLHLKFAAAYILLQLAVAWWAQYRPSEYYRVRDAVVAILRVARLAGAVYFATLVGRTAENVMVKKGITRGPNGVWLLLFKALVHRGRASWSLIFMAQVRGCNSQLFYASQSPSVMPSSATRPDMCNCHDA